MNFTLQSKEEYEKENAQQPKEQEIINAKLLKDNATMQVELDKQKQLNAKLLLDIAKLNGGIA